jgi:hypothetical protein
MPLEGFESKIPTRELPLTHASDRAATGIKLSSPMYWNCCTLLRRLFLSVDCHVLNFGTNDDVSCIYLLLLIILLMTILNLPVPLLKAMLRGLIE